MTELEYNRQAVLEYTEKWSTDRNPAYYDYSELGGDCTNFASQCIFAGSGVMNPKPTYGWYYRAPSDKSPSWTGVPYLYNFLTGNTGPGPYGRDVTPMEVRPGDILQLGDENGRFYHCPVIVAVHGGEIFVAAHSYDAYMRPLSSYIYHTVRFVHIEGVRR